MHRVGRDFKSYSFYWPKAVKDECWYSIEDVLAIIPQPHAVGRKFYVDATLWKNAINKTKQNKTTEIKIPNMKKELQLCMFIHEYEQIYEPI